jgi:hypothetical protein
VHTVNRAAAIAELVAAFADPSLLRVIHRGSRVEPALIPATFAMEHGPTVALALGGLFGDGLAVVEQSGEPIALHAVCGSTFFDPYGLHTRDALLASWADFYQEPVSTFSMRSSNERDSEHFEIDLVSGERAADLRDALLDRCGAAIAVLRG